MFFLALDLIFIAKKITCEIPFKVEYVIGLGVVEITRPVNIVIMIISKQT